MRRILILSFAVMAACTGAASATTFKTLHAFCSEVDCADGGRPSGPLTVGASGVLYGATQTGGAHHDGTVFSLAPDGSFSVLHAFCTRRNCSEGRQPNGGLIEDTQGRLYGTTQFGGNRRGLGTIFRLTPNPSHTRWKLTVLYQFCTPRDCPDGAIPRAGLSYAGQMDGQLYDGVSPLYGTAVIGGSKHSGVVFELSFPGGVPTQKVIWNFCSVTGCVDGLNPDTPLTVETPDVILGTAAAGGRNGGGLVFSLARNDEGGFSQNNVYDFCLQANCADGTSPSSGILVSGSILFGTTLHGGSQNKGVMYGISAGTLTVFHDFCQDAHCPDGQSPRGGVVRDTSGFLYGTTTFGGAHHGVNSGTVYRIGGDKVLHSFCTTRGCPDGDEPIVGLAVDPAGNLFGTTSEGGPTGFGTIFEVTP